MSAVNYSLSEDVKSSVGSAMSFKKDMSFLCVTSLFACFPARMKHYYRDASVWIGAHAQSNEGHDARRQASSRDMVRYTWGLGDEDRKRGHGVTRTELAVRSIQDFMDWVGWGRGRGVRGMRVSA